MRGAGRNVFREDDDPAALAREAFTGSAFGDPVIAGAILDCLLRHSHVLGHPGRELPAPGEEAGDLIGVGMAVVTIPSGNAADTNQPEAGLFRFAIAECDNHLPSSVRLPAMVNVRSAAYGAVAIAGVALRLPRDEAHGELVLHVKGRRICATNLDLSMRIDTPEDGKDLLEARGERLDALKPEARPSEGRP